jgi:hypothetical protein
VTDSVEIRLPPHGPITPTLSAADDRITVSNWLHDASKLKCALMPAPVEIKTPGIGVDIVGDAVFGAGFPNLSASTLWPGRSQLSSLKRALSSARLNLQQQGLKPDSSGEPAVSTIPSRSLCRDDASRRYRPKQLFLFGASLASVEAGICSSQFGAEQEDLTCIVYP